MARSGLAYYRIDGAWPFTGVQKRSLSISACFQAQVTG